MTKAEKTIEIHRFFNRLELSQDDPEVKAWFGESYRAIGPYFKGRVTATGLSLEEEAILMPDVLHIEKNDRSYRQEVRNYFDSLTNNVPKGGLKLNISLEDDSLPLSETNLPINVKEYIIWRHATNHPNVALSRNDAEKDPLKKFFMYDSTQAAVDSVKINEVEDKAMQLYFLHKDNTIKVDQVLTIMGKNIRKMSISDKVIELKKFAQKAAGLPESEQNLKLQRFIDVCIDKDLESKFLIQELIGAQYLEKVGTTILIKESGEKLGDDLREAVLFINNPKNSKLLNILKANYDTKIKKGTFLASKPGVETENKEKTE